MPQAPAAKVDLEFIDHLGHLLVDGIDARSITGREHHVGNNQQVVRSYGLRRLLQVFSFMFETVGFALKLKIYSSFRGRLRPQVLGLFLQASGFILEAFGFTLQSDGPAGQLFV